MLDLHTREHGYTEIFPPVLANADCLFGTAQLPKFEEDLFKTREGYLPDLDRRDPADEPPPRRDPAGGRAADRLHRLHLLLSGGGGSGREGHARADPAASVREGRDRPVRQAGGRRDEALERLTGHAEEVLKRLRLPYRVSALCTGDLGFGAAKTYDLEVWLPGQNAYREISSCSNFGDFQARRASIRFRRAEGEKPEFVHTLNGSGLAVGRTLVAVLENLPERGRLGRDPGGVAAVLRRRRDSVGAAAACGRRVVSSPAPLRRRDSD